MRCKACNRELENVRDRDVGDGIIITEDLCPKCLRIALDWVEKPDEDVYEVLEVLNVRPHWEDGI